MKEPKFYICNHCKNIVEMIFDAGVTPVCCGEPMHEIKANSVDAATEKHVPEVKVNGDAIEVQIGSTIHPMLEEHHIMWIMLVTDKGVFRRELKAGCEPKATFIIKDEKALAVYEYCNLHGLWKIEL